MKLGLIFALSISVSISMYARTDAYKAPDYKFKVTKSTPTPKSASLKSEWGYAYSTDVHESSSRSVASEQVESSPAEIEKSEEIKKAEDNYYRYPSSEDSDYKPSRSVIKPWRVE